MKVNKQGQGYGLFGFIFSLLFFMVIWFVWLGGWLSSVGDFMIETNGLTGIEALICANLNVLLVLVICISIVGFQYFKA